MKRLDFLEPPMTGVEIDEWEAAATIHPGQIIHVGSIR
jgi:hypothetical protein